MAGAGLEGKIYEGKFKGFTTRSICQMMGTYFIDGLNPSPRLTQKMRSQKVDKVHGNDFIAGCIGTLIVL